MDAATLIEALGKITRHAMSQQEALVWCELRSDPAPSILIKAALGKSEYRKLIMLSEITQADDGEYLGIAAVDYAVRRLKQEAA